MERIANATRIITEEGPIGREEDEIDDEEGPGYLRSGDVPGNIVCKESARLRGTEEARSRAIPTYLHRCSRSYEYAYTCNAAVEARFPEYV